MLINYQEPLFDIVHKCLAMCHESIHPCN